MALSRHTDTLRYLSAFGAKRTCAATGADGLRRYWPIAVMGRFKISHCNDLPPHSSLEGTD